MAPSTNAAIEVARIMAAWESDPRLTVSLDADLFKKYFYYVPVLHTVHDQDKNPVFIVVDKAEAIKYCCTHYGLEVKHGT